MPNIQFQWPSRISLAPGQDAVSSSVLVITRWGACWLLVLHLLLSFTPLCSAQDPRFNLQNVSIPLDPEEGQVVYTPFFCNATRVEADPESCAGAWYAVILLYGCLR